MTDLVKHLRFRWISRAIITLFVICVILNTSPSATDLFIDAGHGGVPGTLTHYMAEGFHEREINLLVALALRDTLLSVGCVEGPDCSSSLSVRLSGKGQLRPA